MAKYMIPNEFPSELYDFAKPHARAHWTSYPTYSYEQFYRANPADPKARYKALKAVADDDRANENERKIARRLMAKMEAEGLVKPSKAKKNPRKAKANGSSEANAIFRKIQQLDAQIDALEARGAKVPKKLQAELKRAVADYKREVERTRVFANPRRHTARRNSGEPVFVPVASNAGRFTPNIFPYGMGGRPAVYKENPRPGKYKATQQAGGRFAIPEKAPKEGSFPIDTIKRARYALAIVASPAFDDKGTTRDRVIKAVVEAYPSLRAEADHVRDRVADRKAFRAAANPRRRR